MKNFNRKYKLKINSNEKLKSISDLKITFSIEKSNLSLPNKCYLEIYNTNKETKSILNKKYSEITLEAGYENDMGFIFGGEVVTLFQSKKDTENIIKLYTNDSYQTWINSYTNKTFSSNMTVENSIMNIINDFKGVTIGKISELPKKIDSFSGKTISMPTRLIMDQYGEDYNFNWNIQDKKINIINKEDSLDNENIHIISPLTGMVGSPILTEYGCEVKTLLNHKIKPDSLIEIKAENYTIKSSDLYFIKPNYAEMEGVYKVARLKHSGDTHGNHWFTEIIADRIL